MYATSFVKDARTRFIAEVAQNMGDVKVHRTPVVNREKRLVAFISVGDIATSGRTETTGQAVSGISESGGRGSQAAR